MNKKEILREIAHFVFRTHAFKDKCIKEVAHNIKNKKILEIGSGKKYKESYYYSVQHFFDNSNNFIQSDVIQEYGHEVVDVTKMSFENQFDIILCMNVLEHVFEFHKAIENIHRALKNDGTVIIFLPVFYPLHDEPNDYWRFTEHSIKRLLWSFNTVKIQYSGLRQYPFAYYIEAIK